MTHSDIDGEKKSERENNKKNVLKIDEIETKPFDRKTLIKIVSISNKIDDLKRCRQTDDKSYFFLRLKNCSDGTLCFISG